jgi:hypothetical protein
MLLPFIKTVLSKPQARARNLFHRPRNLIIFQTIKN